MNYKGGKKERKCLKCGNVFFVFPSGTKKYCSKKCTYMDEARWRKIVEKRIKSGKAYSGDVSRRMGGKFNSYTASAKRKKRDFDFDKESFFSIISEPCFYCGDVPAMGIDRVNPMEGYSKSNSLPCCRRCNFAKHTMTLEEFREHIRKIFNNFCKE